MFSVSDNAFLVLLVAANHIPLYLCINTNAGVKAVLDTQLGFTYMQTHTLCKSNKKKKKTFFTPVDTAASCRADLVSHCAFSLCACV